MRLRKPTLDELSQLNQLIYQSKGSWGYSEEMLTKFIDKFGLKAKDYNIYHLNVLEQGNFIIGIINFIFEQELWLDHFFINPELKNKGFGRIMWRFACELALNEGWQSFKLVAEPFAEEFFTHMGATFVEMYESFPGRFVKIMKFNISI